MKTKIAAVTLLIAVTLFVFINAAVVVEKAADYREKVAALSPESEHIAEEVSALYDAFAKDERYISLSVNHDDLTNIEESFAEMIGAAKAGDKEQFTVVKSRLEDAFSHLGRLSGINPDSIF